MPARSARDFFPDAYDLASMREAARACRGCDLFRPATQTVFGEGDAPARFMVVGEQPGDMEDVEGKPFVGPAGRFLDGLFDEVGIDRSSVWLTNAVKHFKFERRGTKRIHLKPTMVEIGACRPWLDSEIELVRPEVVILLGATAAQALFGRRFRITRQRGEWLEWDREPRAMATWHPSAAQRSPKREDRHRKRDEIAEDLRKAASVVR